MLKHLFTALLLLAAAGLWGRWSHRAAADRQRLSANVAALTDSLHRYRTLRGEAAASAAVLQLRCDELEALREADAACIRRLGIRLRRAESFGRTVTESVVEAAAPLHDTVWLHDTVRLFRWADRWVTVEGCIAADSVHCRVASCDTLVQVVHRIPRRFLFIRWGTKALRQEIVSANPHTHIVYAEQLRIER